MSPRDLVEQALTALRGVSMPADVVKSARTAADEIERAWQRVPFVAGLSGDLAARSVLVNHLCDERVLDPFSRALGSPPLRMRHGPRICYRVVREDGAPEERTEPTPEPVDPGERGRLDEARGEVSVHETALATVERGLPMLVRRRLKLWELWLWPVRWLLGLVHRNAMAARRATAKALAGAKRTLGGIEDAIAQRELRDHGVRGQFFSELRVFCGSTESGIREIQLDLPALPEEVELVEMMGELRAAAEVDAVIDVQRDGLHAPRAGAGRVRLGEAAELIPQLPKLLERARALTLARRAYDKLEVARATIDVDVDRAETQFASRLERLDRLALTTDRARYTALQLERMKPMILSSVNAVMEHASTHMGSELAQLGFEWIAAVANSRSRDELKAAITSIEEQWPVVAIRIAEEVRTLVMGGAGGVARDLYAPTVSPLREHGLPEEHLATPKRAPEVAPVAILPSLATPTPFSIGGSWFTGLFKSFDARKTDAREKVHARIEHIREVAAAEMLDAEPKLHASIADALSAQLATALELQAEWHASAVAKERIAIATERETFAPLVKSRDAILGAAQRIEKLADALEAEEPAVAAAAVAAAS